MRYPPDVCPAGIQMESTASPQAVACSLPSCLNAISRKLQEAWNAWNVTQQNGDFCDDGAVHSCASSPSLSIVGGKVMGGT